MTAGPDTGDRTFDVTLDSAGATRTSATRTGGVTATTTFTLTILDEVSAEARPDGSTAKTNHDPAGNPTDACYWKPGVTVGACLPAGTTPWPDPPSQVTSTGYDARNNRISLRTPALGETTYSPDHRERLLRVGRRLVRISRGLVSTGSSLSVGNRLPIVEPRVANRLGSVTVSIFRIHLQP